MDTDLLVVVLYVKLDFWGALSLLEDACCHCLVLVLHVTVQLVFCLFHRLFCVLDVGRSRSTHTWAACRLLASLQVDKALLCAGALLEKPPADAQAIDHLTCRSVSRHDTYSESTCLPW